MPRRDPTKPTRITKSDALAIAGLDYATYENLRKTGYLGTKDGRWTEFDHLEIARIMIVGELWRMGFRAGKAMEIANDLAVRLSDPGARRSYTVGDWPVTLTVDMGALARRVDTGLAALTTGVKEKRPPLSRRPLTPDLIGVSTSEG